MALAGNVLVNSLGFVECQVRRFIKILLVIAILGKDGCANTANGLKFYFLERYADGKTVDNSPTNSFDPNSVARRNKQDAEFIAA
ncbi:MAG TPA: hypothetical protein VFC29_02890 [Candidatus Limnocylindrales bacterium]|nr:hypothetical protein [Candidatus Limnocylindrales bacterium]